MPDVIINQLRSLHAHERDEPLRIPAGVSQSLFIRPLAIIGGPRGIAIIERHQNHTRNEYLIHPPHEVLRGDALLKVGMKVNDGYK
jgi:hypothetical protein